jgi:dTDP-4-amino-4,6-dideoxygalactose transaminase
MTGSTATVVRTAGPVRIPLVRPDLPAAEALGPAIARALASGIVTKGGCLREFEEAAAALIGCRHVVAVGSCTIGLTLVLRSLAALGRERDACLAGKGCPPHGLALLPSEAQRTEVIVPSFIFLAAPAAIAWAGLRPVFVEVSATDYTASTAAVEAAVTDRTAAIMACHTFGCPCDTEALQRVADRAGVPLIVDAAHGLGSRRDGRQVGAEGLAQVFSLSPTKLVVAGEGGLVATSCDCLANLIRMGREYGNDGQYGCWLPGTNGRMPELSAILGLASLQRLEEVAARRAAAAVAYSTALVGIPGLSFQQIPQGCTTSWKDFTIGIDIAQFGMSRDALQQALAASGVETRAYYSPPCHRMKAFRPFLPPHMELPVTDRLADTLLALPMGVHVTPDVAREIADHIRASCPATRRA